MTLNVHEKVLKFESFINDVLKEDLKLLNSQHDAKIGEIAEWTQLKTLILSVKNSHLVNFKGKIDIGCSIFAQVFVPDTDKIILNLGVGVYAEFTIDEALQIIEARIKLYDKQLDVINDASCEVKARIKLVLHGIQELQNIK